MSNIPENDARKLDGKENVLFNVPNLGLQALFAFNTNLIIIFYINILGLPALYAGAVISISLVVSAFLCPIWGALSDRISTRIGRKKTIMAFSGPLLFLSFILIWNPPTPPTSASFGALSIPIAIWIAITVISFNLMGGAFQTSYLSMIPEISTEEENRVKISITNSIMMFLGAALGIISPILIFGTATEDLGRNDPSLFYPISPVGREIYASVALMSILFARLFLGGLILMLFSIKEPPMPSPHDSSVSISDIFKDIFGPFRDHNYRTYILSFFLMFSAINMFNTIVFNFATYVLNIRGNEFFIMAGFALASTIGSYIGFDKLSQKLGLKRVMEICLIVATLSFLSVLILTLPMPFSLKFMLGILIVSFSFIGFVGAMIFPVAIVSSLIDIAQKRDKKNLSGSYLGSFTMTSSLAGGAGMLLISIFLQFFGPEASVSYVLILLLGGILVFIASLIFKNVNLDREHSMLENPINKNDKKKERNL